jgi:L-aminopeptidase/D-esterase-like protein
MERYQRDLARVQARGATHVTGNYGRVLPLNVLSEFHVLAVPRHYARTRRFAREFSRSARRRNPRDFVDF